MSRLLTLCCALIIVPALAFAQGTNIALGGLNVDPSQPVEISADSLVVDQASGKAEFNGNVVIGQGNLRLSAGRVAVTYLADGAGISKLDATGGVTFVTETEAAEADTAVYSLTGKTITMSGNVLLTQGASAISSDKMIIDLQSNSARMDGRVKTILQQGGN